MDLAQASMIRKGVLLISPRRKKERGRRCVLRKSVFGKREWERGGGIWFFDCIGVGGRRDIDEEEE